MIGIFQVASEYYSKVQVRGGGDTPPKGQEELTFEHCPLLNVSQCAPTESDSNFVVNVYNPLAKTVTNKFIRLPVTEG